jgi:hypothetical protein
MVPFLYLVRIFGVLPFSRFKSNRLYVTKFSRVFFFCLQAFFSCFFLLYTITRGISVYAVITSKAEIGSKITSATSYFNLILDIFNCLAVIQLSSLLPRAVDLILRNNEFADGQLEVTDYFWIKFRSFFFPVFASVMLTAKISFLFIVIDRANIFNLSVVCRFIFGMNLVSELLISYLALELRSRFIVLNLRLKQLINADDLNTFESMHRVFVAVNESHYQFAKCIKRFLLTNNSQLLSMIVFRTLNLYFHCEGEGTILCLATAVYAADSSWRFCFVSTCCGLLQNEV